MPITDSLPVNESKSLNEINRVGQSLLTLENVRGRGYSRSHKMATRGNARDVWNVQKVMKSVTFSLRTLFEHPKIHSQKQCMVIL